MDDQYLLNMKFAEELLKFLCTEAPLLFAFRIDWIPKFEILDLENDSEICESVFEEEMGLSVYDIIKEKSKEIRKCFSDFYADIVQQSTKDLDVDDSQFTRCALNVAPLFFPEGYSHGSFLGYCSMVFGVAYNFLMLKTPTCIPQRACQVVALVPFSHQLTGQFYDERGWEGLYDTAWNFQACMGDLNEKRQRKN